MRRRNRWGWSDSVAPSAPLDANTRLWVAVRALEVAAAGLSRSAAREELISDLADAFTAASQDPRELVGALWEAPASPADLARPEAALAAGGVVVWSEGANASRVAQRVTAAHVGAARALAAIRRRLRDAAATYLQDVEYCVDVNHTAFMGAVRGILTDYQRACQPAA